MMKGPSLAHCKSRELITKQLGCGMLSLRSPNVKNSGGVHLVHLEHLVKNLAKVPLGREAQSFHTHKLQAARG